MGKFLNPKQDRREVITAAMAPRSGDPGAPVASAKPPSEPAYPPAPSEESPSILQWTGLWALCLYLASILALEFSMRAFNANLHVGLPAMAVMVGAFLLGGGLLRSFHITLGRLWWLLLLCMLVALPFSSWKSGSLVMLKDYVPRAHFLLFFVCAFVISLRQCHILMCFNALLGYGMLACCLLLGQSDPDSGRLVIPGSPFYGNSNDLAIQLLINMGGLLYLVSQKNPAVRLLGLAALPITLFYLLRTGSRGTFIACLAVLAFMWLYSTGKMKLLLLASCAVTLALALAIVPSRTLGRLTLIFVDPWQEVASGYIASEKEEGSVLSQIQRWEMFKRSVWYTVRYPLFGVGPGQFLMKLGGDTTKQSGHGTWLGTHNMYTQVSSECGIPAALCFVAVIWLSFRTTLRVYKQGRAQPGLATVANLAFSLLAMMVAFAASGLFHHIAYSGYLALLAGQAAALNLAAQPYLGRSPAQS